MRAIEIGETFAPRIEPRLDALKDAGQNVVRSAVRWRGAQL
jgi:hypothetical protein